MAITRRILSVALGLALSAAPALSHQDCRWTSGQTIELTCVIETARLGNPDGVQTVRAVDEVWTVEVGQPGRNERAGLSDDALSPGVELVIAGQPSAHVEQRLLKAENIWIAAVPHNLYPDRG